MTEDLEKNPNKTNGAKNLIKLNKKDGNAINKITKIFQKNPKIANAKMKKNPCKVHFFLTTKI